MKKVVLMLFLTVVVFISGQDVLSGAPSPTPNIVAPDKVKWAPVPGMAGLQMAVLWGDPDKPGSQYAARYKFVDGFKDPPHWHPFAEQATVLSGTYLVGYGDKMNGSNMKAMVPGSFIVVPARVHHYGMAKGETVIEVHGIGPYSNIILK